MACSVAIFSSATSTDLIADNAHVGSNVISNLHLKVALQHFLNAQGHRQLTLSCSTSPLIYWWRMSMFKCIAMIWHLVLDLKAGLRAPGQHHHAFYGSAYCLKTPVIRTLFECSPVIQWLPCSNRQPGMHVGSKSMIVLHEQCVLQRSGKIESFYILLHSSILHEQWDQMLCIYMLP